MAYIKIIFQKMSGFSSMMSSFWRYDMGRSVVNLNLN